MGGREFIQISAGAAATCGLQCDGTAWCWGANSEGQLGDGTLESSTVPVRVAGNHSWAQIAAGQNFVCGIPGVPPQCQRSLPSPAPPSPAPASAAPLVSPAPSSGAPASPAPTPSGSGEMTGSQSSVQGGSSGGGSGIGAAAIAAGVAGACAATGGAMYSNLCSVRSQAVYASTWRCALRSRLKTNPMHDSRSYGSRQRLSLSRVLLQWLRSLGCAGGGAPGAASQRPTGPRARRLLPVRSHSAFCGQTGLIGLRLGSF